MTRTKTVDSRSAENTLAKLEVLLKKAKNCFTDDGQKERFEETSFGVLYALEERIRVIRFYEQKRKYG